MKKLFPILFLLAPAFCKAAPILIASSTLQSGAIPKTISFEVPAGDNLLLLLSFNGQNLGECVYGATYDSVAMSLDLTCIQTTGRWFSMAGPTPGTADIVISQVSGSCGNVLGAGITVWSGVDQTTPVGDGLCSEGSGMGEPLAYNVTTSVEGTIVTDWSAGGNGAPGQAEIIDDRSSYKEMTGATTTMNWATDGGQVDAMQILPASGEPEPPAEETSNPFSGKKKKKGLQ